MPARLHFQKLVDGPACCRRCRQPWCFHATTNRCRSPLSGAFAGYLNPTLVGPEARIRDVAAKAGSISRGCNWWTRGRPAAAGVRAAELARDGHVSALVKGSLSNEEFLGPVVSPDSGLRTERRLSHAYFLDMPGQQRGLLLADAHMNVTPNLAAKRDIVQNTIQLAVALGLAAPNVALLAAMDGPAPSFRSTTDAVALKAMAAQGMFRGAVVDGPLDARQRVVGRSRARAKASSPKSPAASTSSSGPSMESALMVMRTLLALSSGLAAGIVLGARIPVVVPTRYDTMEVRMASCVLADADDGVRQRRRGGESGRPLPARSPRDTGARAAA